MANPAYAGSWSSLPLPLTSWVFDVIQAMGHQQMTPVQASTIPLFMRNKDVVVEAVTGSGKTLAFVIPILERLIRRDHRLKTNEVGALVISPTRELASQIHSVFSVFLSSQPGLPSFASDELSDSPPGQAKPEHPPAMLLVSSSLSSPAQDVQRFLELGSDIIIGTPGRIEEFLLGKGKNAVSVKELEILVLDEADRLLDLGFQQSLTRILTHLPKQRRTGLFSATMTDADAISELVRVGLRNPARIVVKVQSKKMQKQSIAGNMQTTEERRIPANLKIFSLACRPSEKLIQLIRIILHETSQHQSSRFIVYFATGASVDYFYQIIPLFLPKTTQLFSLHGHLPPAARTRTLASFATSHSTASAPCLLLATDVAARGLDVPDVDSVLQFDPPTDTKAFPHRCGRTARAGKSGTAWVLLAGREREYVDFLAVRKIPVRDHSYFLEDGSTSSQNVDERSEDAAVSVFLSTIRKEVLTDRSLHDKAAKAFVSFVQAYSKHEASYIFRVKDLDLVGVAQSYGLLRLPRMPELKQAVTDHWTNADVDWNSYSYADEAQEAKRVAALAAQTHAPRPVDTQRKSAPKKTISWSDKISKKEEREKRRDKKDRKKKWLTSGKTEEQAETLKRAREDRHEDEESEAGDDWAELAREERLAKKLKKGSVTQAQFDEAFGGL
ncbi:DEAD-domain-containing protein [Artomyces pyxidatus]|uniref:DEAD-domain-containing protein n=1 Tax=Artomyces pyxidatus TaxID=48021 RepID=A0ACB8TAT1_9AGAM|nr:DEAD-domain-containing protein [Artomyces pyxidatus]